MLLYRKPKYSNIHKSIIIKKKHNWSTYIVLIRGDIAFKDHMSLLLHI